MKKYIIVILILFVSSCGYHLRGDNLLSQKYPHIKVNISNKSSLKRPLIHALLASGVKLDTNKSEKVAELTIKKDSLIKVIQSVGANNQIQEFRLEYDVEFTIGDKPQKSIHIEKDYSFDIQQITGGQQEEQTLRKQLSDDMAWSIVRQINADISNK